MRKVLLLRNVSIEGQPKEIGEVVEIQDHEVHYFVAQGIASLDIEAKAELVPESLEGIEAKSVKGQKVQ